MLNEADRIRIKLHSLLGVYGSLVFELTESSDWCWFVVKNSTFGKRTNK